MPGKVKVRVSCQDCQQSRTIETDARYAKRLWSSGLLSRCRSCAGKKRKKAPDEVIYSTGYRWIRDETGKLVLEHRHLMSKHLGRPLKTTERVVRIRGKRSDPFRVEDFELREDPVS
jgi:hypothetical protein